MDLASFLRWDSKLSVIWIALFLDDSSLKPSMEEPELFHFETECSESSKSCVKRADTCDNVSIKLDSEILIQPSEIRRL